jgi:hypothetical protein
MAQKYGGSQSLTILISKYFSLKKYLKISRTGNNSKTVQVEMQDKRERCPKQKGEM